MEIITRKDAIIHSSNRYFTGLPCKYGHTCERYTKTANCIECLHPKFENIPTARSAAMSKLRRFRIGLNDWNLERFTSALYAVSYLREPSLNPEDVLTRYAPQSRGGNFHLYTFKAFPEDKECLIAIANSL